MFAIEPYFGFAFLRLLVKRDVVPASYVGELANRQRNRIATHDLTDAEFPININEPSAELIETAANAIDKFLMFDEIMIAALAEKCGFPKLEAIEVLRRA